jgi:hypothetical protein
LLWLPSLVGGNFRVIAEHHLPLAAGGVAVVDNVALAAARPHPDAEPLQHVVPRDVGPAGIGLTTGIHKAQRLQLKSLQNRGLWTQRELLRFPHRKFLRLLVGGSSPPSRTNRDPRNVGRAAHATRQAILRWMLLRPRRRGCLALLRPFRGVSARPLSPTDAPFVQC